MLNAYDAVEKVKQGEINAGSPPLRYTMTYVLMLFFQFSGLGILQELIVAGLCAWRNRERGGDFMGRYALVSAGPMLRQLFALLAVAALAVWTEAPAVAILFLPVVIWTVVRRVRAFTALLDVVDVDGQGQHEAAQETHVAYDVSDEADPWSEEALLKGKEASIQKARVQADLEIENIVQDDVLSTLGLWDELREIKRLRGVGGYDAKDLDLRREDLIYGADWFDIEAPDEKVVAALRARQKEGLLSKEEVSWVQQVIL